MKALNGICAILILLLGLAHTAITLYCRHLDEDGLWFFGSGIAIILAGLFNLLFYYSPTRLIGNFTLIVNLMVTLLFCFALNVIADGQVYFGIVLFAFSTIVVAMRRPKKIGGAGV
jgi:hypothetical protein